MKLLPETWMPYAKSWVALTGVVLVSIGTAWDAAPAWVPAAASVVTAVGVYLTPNAAHEARHSRDTGDS